MSKLLLALLLVSNSVMAEIVATAINKNGGKMVLTSDLCANSKGKIAYSQMDNHPTSTGCWNFDTEFIHILWNDGDLWSYPAAYWNFPKKPLKPNTQEK